MYVNKQINKQKIHMAHYSHNHLGLCRKLFAIALKITTSRIKAVFAVLYSFFIRSLGNLKLNKEQQSFIMSVFIVVFL